MQEMTKLEKARRASGITVEAAAGIIGVSYPTMLAYQRDPSRMSFGQYFALAAEMDDESRAIMEGTLEEVDAMRTEWKQLDDVTLGEFYSARNGIGKLERELGARKGAVFG